ncbi:MAG: LysM peptidoglycan-binding domain-containing protein, partial [Planctomycetota bacterium]
MTREIKLSLLLGFGLVLAVGLLISDHLSKASTHQASGYPVADASSGAAPSPGFGRYTLGVSGTGGTAVAGGQELLDLVLEGPELQPAAQFEELRQEHGRATLNRSVEEDGPVILEMGQARSQSTEARRATAPEGVVHSLHRVQRNENLWKIAEKYYGTGAVYPQLAAFNRDRVFGEDGVSVGTTLIIPSYEQLLDGPGQ